MRKIVVEVLKRPPYFMADVTAEILFSDSILDKARKHVQFMKVNNLGPGSTPVDIKVTFRNSDESLASLEKVDTLSTIKVFKDGSALFLFSLKNDHESDPLCTVVHETVKFNLTDSEEVK